LIETEFSTAQSETRQLMQEYCDRTLWERISYLQSQKGEFELKVWVPVLCAPEQHQSLSF
jgi:hypothetical protein